MSEFEEWIANCHLREVEGSREYHCQAAVWADNYNNFRARLAAHIARQGYSVLWIEECMPVSQYLHRHGNPHKIGPLVRAVHPGHFVEIGPIVAVDANSETVQEDCLIIEEIGGVEPLDLHTRKAVPDILYGLLFGQLEPTKAEITHYGNAEAVPPMRTYAILDAAKMPYLLTGFIESSELPYQCLFKGKAAEKLKEYSPYLVELKESNDFTKRILTGPKELNSLWEKDLGIYIRSRAEFAEVRRHFRKFTWVQDEKGKWYYFRFWEGINLLSICKKNQYKYLDSIANSLIKIEFLIFLIIKENIYKIKRNFENKNQQKAIITQNDWESFEEVSKFKLVDRIYDDLSGRISNLNREDVHKNINEALRLGLYFERSVYLYVASVMFGGNEHEIKFYIKDQIDKGVRERDLMRIFEEIIYG